jgi:hypothetical protein
MFERSLPITLLMLILIFVFGNCGGNAEQLTEDEIEFTASLKFRDIQDSLKKLVLQECKDEQQKFINSKVDSLIIEHLKTRDTTSLPLNN